MGAAKIVIRNPGDVLPELDKLVSKAVFPSRSGAIQKAILDLPNPRNGKCKDLERTQAERAP